MQSFGSRDRDKGGGGGGGGADSRQTEAGGGAGAEQRVKLERGGGAQQHSSRRGTLAEIRWPDNNTVGEIFSIILNFSKNLPWGRRESQAEVMSKIRKRRETSADITIFRKSAVLETKTETRSVFIL